YLQFMLEGMACKGGMVYLDINLKIIKQVPLAKKTNYGLTVKIVLVLGGFHGLRLDQESTFKTILPGIVFYRMQEAGQVLFFSFHIGIEQRHIPFSPAPEHIAFSAQLNGSVYRC